MKKSFKIGFFGLMIISFIGSSLVSVAQKRTSSTKGTKTTSASTPSPSKVLDATITGVPLTDTAKKPINKTPDPFAFDSVRVSLRNDAAIERNLNVGRVPLPYEHIREDDAWYRERVWREIDIREKMNLPFRYKAESDNGTQRFINILLRAVRNGDVTAFNPGINDDRFTKPMTMAEVGDALDVKCKDEEVPDWSRGGTVMKDTVVCNEFNPDTIVKYRLKEEWIFDKESSKMFARIIGIAPIKRSYDAAGNYLGEAPIFWIYYPDLRETLSKYEVYNGKNSGSRLTWEELFESRYFSSSIVKSSIDNPYDLYIKQYIDNPILRLLEGDAIKSKIFNFEQDLWSF